jgi:O-antigen/teichoic acid export membrane protein
LIGYAVNTLLNLWWFARLAPNRLRLQLDRQLAVDFIRYGLRYGVVFATSLTILTQFDNFIVGLLRGTAELGYYDRAYRTSLWPTLLFSASLGRVTLPTYSLMRDDPQQLGKTYALVLWSVLTFTTPLAIMFLLTAQDLVPVLYGPRWLPAVPLLQALAAFSVFRTMLDDVRSILVATDRSQLFARVMFWQALLMVVLVVPLTYVYGSVGTAVAVGVAFFLSTIFVHYFGYTQLHMNLIETSLLPVLNNLLALGAYLIIWPRLPTSALAAWERLGLEIFLIAGLYVAISLLTSRRLIVSRLGLIWRSLRASS